MKKLIISLLLLSALPAFCISDNDSNPTDSDQGTSNILVHSDSSNTSGGFNLQDRAPENTPTSRMKKNFETCCGTICAGGCCILGIGIVGALQVLLYFSGYWDGSTAGYIEGYKDGNSTDHADCEWFLKDVCRLAALSNCNP